MKFGIHNSSWLDAPDTTRIRLATLCTAVGYRNPAHLAKIAASVDLISRGRLTLGIGAGFFEDEYKQYGWEFAAQPATRVRQMEEAVRLISKFAPNHVWPSSAGISTSRMRSSSGSRCKSRVRR
jgi:alkanesulfonate monooxygenase SsuD/methylene tetrahydromethanopterin reductase-like flavin-dependent oxidoreductase (luciferase family)